MPEYNLVTESLLGVEYSNGTRERLSLPGILAALSSGKELEFTALQAHQMHAWHAFLVQLAALAMHATADDKLERSPSGWRAAILMLTDGQQEPWCLVVENLALAALLQPPVPEGTIDAIKNEILTPDGIDLLVTSRNHDVKRRRVRSPSPELWMYALVSVQTMDGYPGKNNYGISRMNGAYGNRSGIGVARDARWPSRWRRDTRLLLDSREGLVRDFEYRRSGGIALLWTQPWDGRSSISPTDCDPFFIEICRRIRLSRAGTEVVARAVGTTRPRIEAKQLKGNLGDPWVPIRREDSAALTARNLSYKILQDVVFGNSYKPSPACAVLEEDGPTPTLSARLLARGKGGTEGLHERILPFPPRARRLLATVDGRARLGKMSQQWVEVVATVRKKVLRPALLVLLQGGPNKPNYKDGRCDALASGLDRCADEIFFERLFDAISVEPSEARCDWVTLVIDLARQILRDATVSLPVASIHRYRAISAAERLFDGAARKQFLDVFAERGEGRHEGSDGARP